MIMVSPSRTYSQKNPPEDKKPSGGSKKTKHIFLTL